MCLYDQMLGRDTPPEERNRAIDVAFRATRAHCTRTYGAHLYPLDHARLSDLQTKGTPLLRAAFVLTQLAHDVALRVMVEERIPTPEGVDKARAFAGALHCAVSSLYTTPYTERRASRYVTTMMAHLTMIWNTTTTGAQINAVVENMTGTRVFAIPLAASSRVQ